MKEYLSRGTYVFPPDASMRLTSEIVAYTVSEVPRWNPINICSYHLQEAGATPVQEIAFAMANAISVLDRVRDQDDVSEQILPRVFGRVSFFLNAGIRFVEEMCKCRAMTRLWSEIGRERYGIDDEKMLRFRYGVQVNSLGLTEAQPENNIIRITLEALGVTVSKRARTRSLQLPAWNEALGLPRPWDQQLSLRTQQILAFETDLLEYEDLFDGSHVVEALTEQLLEAAREELQCVLEMGGAVRAVENAYMKSAPRRKPHGTPAGDRIRRSDHRGGQPLSGLRRVAAGDRRLRVDPQGGRIGRTRADRPPRGVPQWTQRGKR